MIRRPLRRTRRKSTGDPSKARIGTPIEIPNQLLEITTAAQARFSQFQPFMVNGTPGWVCPTNPILSFVQTDQLTMLVNFTNNIEATDLVTIPAFDPAIRNFTGGYVVGGIYAIDV